MIKLAETILHDILDELTDRSGFDSWWYGCDVSIQQEIENAIMNIIDSNVEREKSLLNSEEN